MRRQLVSLILCVGVVPIVSACATKGFVREQQAAAETKIAQRLDTQEAMLREQQATLRQTSDRTLANSQAIDAASGRLQGVATRVDAIDSRVGSIDTRVGEVGAVAGDARKQADAASAGVRDTETRLSQRFANRNNFVVLEEKSVYFDSGKADVREADTAVLQEVVAALKSNPNAVVELQGFTDPRGGNRYNYQLSRERVDAVVRYLVKKQGVDLRRVSTVGMGPEAPVEKASKEAFAKSRRVDIRLLGTKS